MTTEPTNRQLDQKVKELEKELARLNGTEESLIQEKAFSDAIIRSLPGIFYLFDHKGTFIRWSRTLEQVSGYSAQEISRMHPLDFFEGDDKTKVGERIQQSLVKGASTAEAEFVPKSGKKALYYLTGHRAMVGEKTYVAGMGIDITSRKKSEEALKKSEKQYKDLVENSLIGISKTNLKGDILFVNDAWVTTCEFDSMEELMSHKAMEGYKNPKDRDVLIERLKKTGKVTGFEFEIRTRNGNIKNLVMNAVLDGEYIFGTIMDISERRQHENLIRRQRDLGVALSNATNLQDGLRLCLDAALHVSKMDSGGIYLTDEKTGGLSLVFHKGLSSVFVQTRSHYDADSDHAKLVMAGRTVYAKKEDLAALLGETKQGEELTSMAVIPVHHKNRVIGCLNVASRALHDVPPSARVALEGICIHIGSAITRLQAEDALKNTEQELEAEARRLHESNIALKVLLRNRREDKEQFEENVLLAVKQLVLPYLQELDRSSLRQDQKALLGIVQSNLKNIVSPFVRKLSSQFLNLTPAEIRVADLVKQGKTNKEIAEVLRVSVHTILTHRDALRKKLGLTNRKINLKSYLLSLEE